MTTLEIGLALGAMTIAVLGILVGFVGAVIHFQLTPRDIYQRMSQRYWSNRLQEVIDQLPPEEEKLPAPNYRHNVHCPSCGRFAKRVFDSNEMVECKHHGVLIRWKDLPIDWVTRTIAPGVTLYTEPIPVTEYMEPKAVTLNTGPIPVIVVPNDLSEFESWGARI